MGRSGLDVHIVMASANSKMFGGGGICISVTYWEVPHSDKEAAGRSALGS